MMPLAQHIRVRTVQSRQLDILVIEEGNSKFSVLMSAAAFPVGSTFGSAEDAIVAARNALNAILTPDKVLSMSSDPKEEFVNNAKLVNLV